MVKRKESEKEMEIAEALGFIKSMKKNAPPENQTLRDILLEDEQGLHEDLFRCCFEKFNDRREGA